MTKEQIINFAKAPFSRSFGVPYLSTLPNLLLIPFLSDLIHFLSENYEKFNNQTTEELKELFIHSFFPNLNITHVFIAIVGFITSIILLNGYKIGLINQTIKEKKDIFEVSRIKLSISFFFLSVIKSLGASLVCISLCIFPITILGALIALGLYVGEHLNLTIISVITGIVGCVFFLILLYKLICYFFSANLFFLHTLKISSLIHYKEVNSFFQKNKNNIFITFLLTYVCGEMLNVLLSSIITKIFETTIVIGTMFSLFSLRCYWILALSLLVFNFLWVYLSLLHGIACGKVILWLDKSKVKN